MPTIYIDDKPYEVKAGQNLLNAVLSLGMDLPYFCWHPAMGSIGACRQCAVKQYQDENDKQGRIVMACMTPAADGTRISIDDPEVQQFRANVIEWLMVNHPHDCPVCDEGGECHLQDMTVMTGHNYREFRFKKRTHRNQDLGPFINHEMNRCIACYRCVRFYDDYAGGDDLQAFAAHDHVYFGRHEDGVLESEFSGNLVEVCPTGVFTDKTLQRHYTRKWDLQSAPSVCHHCGLGCNTLAGERYGTLRRILNRYNRAVNGYFLCDRGRFGYEFVNSDDRIRVPQLRYRGDKDTEEISRDDAMRQAAEMLDTSSGLVGIGSPRASLESNYALRKLVGKDRFFTGMSENENHLISEVFDILRNGPARSASLDDIRKADAVFVLGEDVLNTAPMAGLNIRQAIRNQPMEGVEEMGIPEWHDAAVREVVQGEHGPLYLATLTGTKLDREATDTYHAAPEDIARLGFAVAHELNDDVPEVTDLDQDVQQLAEAIARALQNAKRPLVISGVSLGSEEVIRAAANIAWSLSTAETPADIHYIVSEANTLGLGFFESGGLDSALEMVESGEADTAVILENDIWHRAAPEAVESFFDTCKQVIVLDHLETGTVAAADLLLPAATFAEGDGTVINNEGRAQRFFQVFAPEEPLQESWRWLGEMCKQQGNDPRWNSHDDVSNMLFQDIRTFAGLVHVAPDSEFRLNNQRVPRSPFRYSGRTAMFADRDVHEPQPPEDPDSPLHFSMEGTSKQQPSGLTTFFWAPGWNSVQATNKYQSEIGGSLRGGDPGVRLIEPSKGATPEYFTDIPEQFSRDATEWVAAPVHHIFGSEELSARAEGVSQLVPDSYVVLNPADAKRFGDGEEITVALEIGSSIYTERVKTDSTLPEGIVGVPVNIEELSKIQLPDRANITEAESV